MMAKTKVGGVMPIRMLLYIPDTGEYKGVLAGCKTFLVIGPLLEDSVYQCIADAMPYGVFSKRDLYANRYVRRNSISLHNTWNEPDGNRI